MNQEEFCFSVFRYIDDPATGESVNVGIVVAEAAHADERQPKDEASQLLVRFVSNWNRLLGVFPNADVESLWELDSAIQDLLPEKGITFERLLTTLHATKRALCLEFFALSAPEILVAKDLSTAADDLMERYVWPRRRC